MKAIRPSKVNAPVLVRDSQEEALPPLPFGPGTLFLDDVFVTLSGLLHHVDVQLKIEGFNFGGSIKMKTALSLIESLERSGALRRGRRVIESSSGNLGVALAIVCRLRGYEFLCVVDPNAMPVNLRLIEAFGGRLIRCEKRDANGGYLQSRLDLITEALRRNPDLVWPNQYANPANSEAHRRWTAPAILRRYPKVDFLFIGAGTTGTLMGCAAYFREASPRTQVIAVDAVGSVTFGYPSRKRYIPGIGTSRKPKLCNRNLIDRLVMVPEEMCIAVCRRVARTYGMLIGGSTGSTLAAVMLSEADIPLGSTVVAIGPDLGERYLDTVYNDAWVRAHFPGIALEPLSSVADRACTSSVSTEDRTSRGVSKERKREKLHAR